MYREIAFDKQGEFFYNVQGATYRNGDSSMKLYHIGNVAGVEVFVLASHKPKPLVPTLTRPREMGGLRISEQQGALYVETAYVPPLLVSSGKVVLLWGHGYETDGLRINAELVTSYADRCFVFLSGTPFVVYKHNGREAWQGVAGESDLRRCIHPDTKRV